MSTLRIVKLTHTNDRDLLLQRVELMRPLRLKSLQTDAENFKSKYSDEVNQPTDFWIGRLQGANAYHWVAKDIQQNLHAAETLTDESGIWVGFLVVLYLGEETLQKSSDGVDLADRYPHYQMGAVYIDPSYRGRGLGTSILEAAIEDVKLMQKQRGGGKLIFSLGVRQHNLTARKLYTKLGFSEFDWEIETTADGTKDEMEIMRKVVET